MLYKVENFSVLFVFNSLLEAMGSKMESKVRDWHRKSEGDACYKPMRSDHLSQHKHTHKDLPSPDNEIKDKLKTRQEIKKKQEEKIWKIEEIGR